MAFCIPNSDFSTRIASLYRPQPSSVVLCIHKSDIMTRINSLYGSQTSPVVLCIQNNVICIRITSLYRSQPSSVVFACKTLTFGSELQVSISPRPHLWFFACKTMWLASELLVSMGPSPYLWFLHVLGFKLLYDNEHISKTLQRTEKPKVTRGKENSRSPLPVYHMIPLHHSPHCELVNVVNKACWPVYPASWTCNLLTYNWRLWRNSLWRWRRCRSRVVRWMFKWGWHLRFTMGTFETVEEDGVLSAIDVNGVVLVSSFKHLIRPIVRLLQRFPNSVMPDEYMCARR